MTQSTEESWNFIDKIFPTVCSMLITKSYLLSVNKTCLWNESLVQSTNDLLDRIKLHMYNRVYAYINSYCLLNEGSITLTAIKSLQNLLHNSLERWIGLLWAVMSDSFCSDKFIVSEQQVEHYGILMKEERQWSQDHESELQNMWRTYLNTLNKTEQSATDHEHISAHCNLYSQQLLDWHFFSQLLCVIHDMSDEHEFSVNARSFLRAINFTVATKFTMHEFSEQIFMMKSFLEFAFLRVEIESEGFILANLQKALSSLFKCHDAIILKEMKSMILNSLEYTEQTTMANFWLYDQFKLSDIDNKKSVSRVTLHTRNEEKCQEGVSEKFESITTPKEVSENLSAELPSCASLETFDSVHNFDKINQFNQCSHNKQQSEINQELLLKDNYDWITNVANIDVENKKLDHYIDPFKCSCINLFPFVYYFADKIFKIKFVKMLHRCFFECGLNLANLCSQKLSEYRVYLDDDEQPLTFNRSKITKEIVDFNVCAESCNNNHSSNGRRENVDLPIEVTEYNLVQKVICCVSHTCRNLVYKLYEFNQPLLILATQEAD